MRAYEAHQLRERSAPRSAGAAHRLKNVLVIVHGNAGPLCAKIAPRPRARPGQRSAVKGTRVRAKLRALEGGSVFFLTLLQNQQSCNFYSIVRSTSLVCDSEDTPLIKS
jgi:hypothetical protein